MFKPSPQQQAIFDEVLKPDCGSLIIEAKAGSGKTTTIVEAAKLMSGSIFLGAFNRNMADELIDRCSNIPNTKCETFHTIGRRSIVDFSGGAFIKTNSRKIVDRIKEMTDDPIYDKEAWKIAKLISMAKNRGIGAIEENKVHNWYDMIEHHTLDDSLNEKFDDRDEMFKLIRFCQAVLEADINESDDVDFDDMLYLPLRFNMPLPQFDWVMIDEAQDTNRVRREIATRMLKPGGKLIAVGDPNQAIYGFTGADNDAMERIRTQFQAKVMPLSVSYRCPQNIINVARTYVPGIEAHEDNTGGVVTTIKYHDIVSKAKPGDVVLSRFNKYLIDICFKFLRKGIPVKIVGRDVSASLVSLAKRWKTQKFDELTTFINRWEKREEERIKDSGVDKSTEHIKDRAESLRIMIARAKEMGLKTKDDMIKMIEDMFVDDGSSMSKTIVILSSVHRSKGMEWDNVFLIGRNEIMGKLGKNQWQKDQERNLIYVGVTRAKKTLTDVIDVPQKL